VLDEPFNALDTAASEWLAGLVRTQLVAGGVVVLTSHQAVPVDDVADPVTVAL
jgi:ABC-type transport system involved in cytochrome c biogenesis ATPase subunit